MILFAILGFLNIEMTAQSTADSTVYNVVDILPRFPACEQLDTTVAYKKRCADEQLLRFFAQTINYPFEARKQNIQGTVVISFVVEKNGTLSNFKILKDIGGGCAAEAIRIAEVMNEIKVIWVPAWKDGQPVRFEQILPVRFKLEDPKPYVFIEGDTSYVEVDKPLEFKAGTDSLSAYLGRNIDYPVIGNDSCIIGNIDVQILVQPDDKVRVLNIVDYNNLGFDFWYEAIDAATSTYGMWNQAEYQGRKVPVAFDLSVSFIPRADHCKEDVDRYIQAMELLSEGSEMFNGEEKEAGVEKMTQAKELFPNDASILMTRGQALVELNRFDEACEDLSAARRIALIKWFDSILPVICK